MRTLRYEITFNENDTNVLIFLDTTNDKRFKKNVSSKAIDPPFPFVRIFLYIAQEIKIFLLIYIFHLLFSNRLVPISRSSARE